MRKHTDPETLELCSVTVTRSEHRRASRGHRCRRDRGRTYVRVHCQIRGRDVLVPVRIVPDGSPEARRHAVR